MPSTFEENLEKSSFQEAWQYAVETARRKAGEVADRLKVHTPLFMVHDTYLYIHDIILILRSAQ